MSKQRIDAILEVTKRCNLRCRTCLAWKRPEEKDELTIGEWKAVINSISKALNQDVSVILGGGEPLLKEGILDVVKLCCENGYETSISTNGFNIDDKMAKEITASGLSNVFLSLNSLNHKTHDFFKGMPGSHDKLMSAIEHISANRKDAKPGIVIGSLIADRNLEDLPDLVKWVSSDNRLSGIVFQALAKPFYTEEDNEWHFKDKYEGLWPKDISRVKNIIEDLIKFKQSGYKILTPVSQLRAFINYYKDPKEFIRKGDCHLGYRNFSIGSDGYIFLCFLMEPIGNIRENDFKTIWNSDKANESRQIIRECKKNCQILVNCWFDEE